MSNYLFKMFIVIPPETAMTKQRNKENLRMILVERKKQGEEGKKRRRDKREGGKNILV